MLRMLTDGPLTSHVLIHCCICPNGWGRLLVGLQRAGYGRFKSAPYPSPLPPSPSHVLLLGNPSSHLPIAVDCHLSTFIAYHYLPLTVLPPHSARILSCGVVLPCVCSSPRGVGTCALLDVHCCRHFHAPCKSVAKLQCGRGGWYLHLSHRMGAGTQHARRPALVKL